MIRIVLLLSGRHGRGSNMAALAAASAEGSIAGQIVRVIGSHAASPALARAREMDLETQVLSPPTSGEDEAVYTHALLSALSDAKADLVCLAGYLRRVPPAVVDMYAGRIMNTHPALLPAFGGQGMYGARVHQAVLDYGAKVSGCTVHFVDESYDTGPVILQIPVPVEEDDTAETLAARVLEAEHKAFPAAVSLFAQGRLSAKGRRVFILPKA